MQLVIWNITTYHLSSISMKGRFGTSTKYRVLLGTIAYKRLNNYRNDHQWQEIGMKNGHLWQEPILPSNPRPSNLAPKLLNPSTHLHNQEL